MLFPGTVALQVAAAAVCSNIKQGIYLNASQLGNGCDRLLPCAAAPHLYTRDDRDLKRRVLNLLWALSPFLFLAFECLCAASDEES